MQRAIGTDLLSNAAAGVVYIPEEGRLVLQVDILTQGCPCCFGRAFARGLFRHLLHTQIPWPVLTWLRSFLSHGMTGAYRVLRALGEDVEYKPEALAAAVFAEWVNPRDGVLPIEVQDGAEEQLMDLLARDGADREEVGFYSYSWLIETADDLFGDMVVFSTMAGEAAVATDELV